MKRVGSCALGSSGLMFVDYRWTTLIQCFWGGGALRLSEFGDNLQDNLASCLWMLKGRNFCRHLYKQ